MNAQLLFHLLILIFLLGTGTFTLIRANTRKYEGQISDTFYVLFVLTYSAAILGQVVSMLMAVTR